MNIMDLAKVMAPECEVDLIGIRPGEKVHEAMISSDEAHQATELDDRYAILPAHPWWSSKNWSEGKKLPDGWAYTSDSNSQWLAPDEMQAMLDG
jgi:UDP-N-acetylglucosamine 4,6-dehydratase